MPIVSPVSLSLIFFALASSDDEARVCTALAREIKAGNHQAFQTFFDSHHNALFHFLVSKNTSTEAAKDLIQQAFIYIWEHRHKIGPQKSLRA